jgi:replicative DNA helicase
MSNQLLPHAQELEKAIISACVKFRDTYPQAADILKSEYFHAPKHQVIFAAMTSMFNAGIKFDSLLLTEELKKNGDLELAGGVKYLQELSRYVKFSMDVDAHATIIAERFIARNGIETLSEVVGDFYDPKADVFEAIGKADSWISDVNNIGPGSKPVDLETAAADFIQKIEDFHESGQDLPPGLQMGFTDLDKMLCGLQGGDMTILAARPAMGKTAFVLKLARNVAADGKGVAFFSLEMSTAQLTGRMLSGDSQINGQKMRAINLLTPHERELLKESREKFRKWDLKIADDAGASMSKIRARSREIKREFERKGKTLDVVIIDYLQLVGDDSNSKKSSNREQDVSRMSRSCKMLAKELDVPVVVLCQLSRAVETRGGDKRPQLSDLRESGSLEQDADQVLFLYRPEYYGIDEDEQGNSLKGIAYVIVGKNRHGECRDVPMRFISDFADFSDLDNEDFDLLPDNMEKKSKWQGSGVAAPEYQPKPSLPSVTAQPRNDNELVPF